MLQDKFGCLYEKNIPRLKNVSGFTRNELIKLYSQFKALCEVTAEKNLRSRYDVSLGVDYETFKESVPEVAFETDNFVKRVFEIANENPS